MYDYLKLLQRLDPTGLFWRTSARLKGTLQALANVIDTASKRLEAVRAQANPGSSTSDGLLPEWIDALGLPDSCTGETTAEAAAARVKRPAGARPQDIIDLLAFVVPGWTGHLYEIHADGIGAPAWLDSVYYGHTFLLETDGASATTVWHADVDNADCDDPFERWGDKILECAINRVKLTHTVAIFTYPDV